MNEQINGKKFPISKSCVTENNDGLESDRSSDKVHDIFSRRKSFQIDSNAEL